MRFLRSFLFALRGLKDCLLHEKNFRIQFAIALLTAVAGFFFTISYLEWLAILICFAIILSLEIINSAIEKLCDLVDSTFNTSVKRIKDMAAAAVLISAIITFIIGCIIFLPKIKILFSL